MAGRLSALMAAVGTALLVAAGIAWSAGSATAGAAAEAPKGGTLRLGTPEDLDFVDPALAYTSASWPVGFATCAKLFNYPDEPGAAGTRLVPEVVRSFTVSKDGRVYSFELKRTFRFHTGAPVTAHSFAAAFGRDANPRMRSDATAFMHEIVGADAVIAGKARSISGIRVPGRYRLQVRLTRPVGDFTARLTLPFFCPVLSSTPVDPLGVDDPPGSGPYYVAERIVNRRIVLKRNPFYRGARPANVDRIVWTIGQSGESCLRAIEQDATDHCDQLGIPVTAYPRLAETYGINRPGGQFFVNPSLNTWYVAFNHDRPAFRGPGQVALKKAINYAIDRPALARVLGPLGGRRTDQMLPPALGRAESIYPLGGADPATARKWLARATLRPEKLVFYAGNRERGVGIAQVLAFNLKQIGIELEVKYFDRLTLLEKAGTRGEPFDLAMSNWLVDYADPAAFFQVLLNPSLTPAGNLNLSYFSDTGVTARMSAANRLTGAARREAWAELDADLMRNDPPWAPFLHEAEREFVSRSFGCYVFHPVYGVDLAAACKK